MRVEDRNGTGLAKVAISVETLEGGFQHVVITEKTRTCIYSSQL
jgi:hypothetical protein